MVVTGGCPVERDDRAMYAVLDSVRWSTMMIAIAVAIALLAVLAGVLLAAFDVPQADADPRLQRLSLAFLVTASMTAAAGVAYALFV